MDSLRELTDRIRAARAKGVDLGESIKLDLKGEGFIHVDGLTVSNEDRVADLTVTVSVADLAALGRGELDPVRAMMTGRLKLSDMGLAMRMRPAIQLLFAKSV
jgi:putative sterol carrier protein